MKAGLATSMVLHAAVLTYGLVTLSAPSPFEVADVESLPVDIVPVEELTQILEGDKTAAVSETPAPVPTQKPQTVPDAQEIGDNEQDLSTPPTPEAKPREVEAAAEPPPPPPEPAPRPEPIPEPAPAPEPEPQPVVEETPEPPPQPAVTPEPAPAAAVAEAAPEAEAVKLPDTAPAPRARPKPPEQVAEAPKKAAEAEKKVAEKPRVEKPKAEEKAEEASLEDQVAMLLNKEKASGGGAKRSTQAASFGGEKKTAGSQKLSQGEMDALRSQLGGCWNLPAGAEGAEGLRVSVRFQVGASGKIDGQPEVTTSSGNRTFDESALRAIRKCDRQGLILPKDKADVWSEIVVNFDPSDMIF